MCDYSKNPNRNTTDGGKMYSNTCLEANLGDFGALHCKLRARVVYLGDHLIDDSLEKPHSSGMKRQRQSLFRKGKKTSDYQ